MVSLRMLHACLDKITSALMKDLGGCGCKHARAKYRICVLKL